MYGYTCLFRPMNQHACVYGDQSPTSNVFPSCSLHSETESLTEHLKFTHFAHLAGNPISAYLSGLRTKVTDTQFYSLVFIWD